MFFKMHLLEDHTNCLSKISKYFGNCIAYCIQLGYCADSFVYFVFSTPTRHPMVGRAFHSGCSQWYCCYSGDGPCRRGTWGVDSCRMRHCSGVDVSRSSCCSHPSCWYVGAGRYRRLGAGYADAVDAAACRWTCWSDLCYVGGCTGPERTAPSLNHVESSAE